MVARLRMPSTRLGPSYAPEARWPIWEQTPFIYENGVLSVLSGIGEALDVNDNGAVVGQMYIFGGTYHASMWMNGSVIDLGTLPGETGSRATAINNPGQVVGYSGLRAFRWENGVMMELPSALGATWSVANDINDAGEIVGHINGQSAIRWTLTPPNLSPIAFVGGPYTGTEGTAVALDGTLSSDPNGDVLTYSWDYGDGSALGSGATPTHSYAQNGSYTLTLTVQDPGGLTSQASTSVTVANDPPVPNAGPDRTVVAKRSLTYTVAFTDAGTLDAPWNYVVRWGDGTANTSKQTNVQGNQPALAHTYNTVGTFTRRLTATDKDGGTAFDEAISSVVANSPPIAATTGPYIGNEGTAVAMASTGSSDPNGDVLTYAWKFGDGTTSTAANPSKTYTDNGAFTVTLIVKDPSGAADTATTTATIANVAPTARFVAPTTVTEGVAIALAMNSGTDKGAADRPAL